MYRPFKRIHALRKTPKKITCHQCDKKFSVRCLRVEANCPRCSKKHVVRTGRPTPYKKVKYWKGDKLVEIPKELRSSFKNDPQAFGFEIALRAIPLNINPYLNKKEALQFEEGIKIGIEERRKK